jgi:AcrR family transcriptional regulator
MSGVAATRPTYAEASKTLLRDSVLDAVGELLADDAWSDVTMAAVATRAGVSRQTLYNAFGGREELAQAYLMREAERFLDAIEDAVVSNVDDPRRALTQAAELFLSLVSTHPMVRAIATQEGEQLVAMATTRGGALLTAMTDRLSELILANWPKVDPGGARLLAATLVRLAISHAVLPTGAPGRTAADIARTLGPFIDELLGEVA